MRECLYSASRVGWLPECPLFGRDHRLALSKGQEHYLPYTRIYILLIELWTGRRAPKSSMGGGLVPAIFVNSELAANGFVNRGFLLRVYWFPKLVWSQSDALVSGANRMIAR